MVLERPEAEDQCGRFCETSEKTLEKTLEKTP
jgi:hypothetical protein